MKKTRVIDYDFFCKFNFSFISTFDEFGWTKFLSLNYPLLENLVRAFYSNAICVEVDNDGNAMFFNHITTFVMGRTLVVNKESIARVLGIPDIRNVMKNSHFLTP